MKIVLFNTYIFDNNFIFNIINFCSSLINISNLFIFGLISILSLIFIHMSKKPLLDAAHKAITGAAAMTVNYQNVIKGGGSSSNDDDNDKDKNKNNKSNTEPDNGGNSGSTDNNSNSNNSNTTDTSESQNK